jgi:hypothetical protein
MYARKIKDIYNENYKSLMKEIKEDTNNVMTAPVHGWEESMFLK